MQTSTVNYLLLVSFKQLLLSVIFASSSVVLHCLTHPHLYVGRTHSFIMKIYIALLLATTKESTRSKHRMIQAFMLWASVPEEAEDENKIKKERVGDAVI